MHVLISPERIREAILIIFIDMAAVQVKLSNKLPGLQERWLICISQEVAFVRGQ